MALPFPIAFITAPIKLLVESLKAWKKRDKEQRRKVAERKKQEKTELNERREFWAQWRDEQRRRGIEMEERNAEKIASRAKEDIRVIDENPY